MKNYKLKSIKRRYAYNYKEVEALLSVRHRTISEWVKKGLSLIDPTVSPKLILGNELKGFLSHRQLNRKTRLKEGEFYCFHCRKGVLPLPNSLIKNIRNKMGKGKRLVVTEASCSFCLNRINRFSTQMDFQTIEGHSFLLNQKGIEELPLFKAAR